MTVELETQGDVRILHMSDGENRFNRAATKGPVALVTVGAGKFFFNGLDLEWMTADGAGDTGFLDDVHRMLQRTLALDVVTVAAINGHAFAGGASSTTSTEAPARRPP